jgi:putative CocE/NonD family hydrolase
LAGALGDEDDRSRYVTSEKVLIRTAAGIDIQARVVRPKNISKALPALLEFALTGAHDGARGSAAHGYVGVVAYTRRPSGARRDSTAPIVPFEHDGEDARAVIDWIARQPWSDGRVGMFGNGYSGFAAWAAAKGLPPALKAIATADAMAPGIDFPMEGNIFPTTAYAWAASTAHVGADASISDGDEARWRAIEQDWYRSGQSFRSLVRAGKSAKPNWTFGRWLNHPSYDQYWQMMTPVGEQFARIDIPVLSTTGYYAGGEIGSLYYFTQHLRYRPRADHTLVIGPYDGNGIHVRPSPVLRGYPVDAAALVDLAELRFQWFDHIFKGAARPSLLKDRVNYEVMGANEWQHAPTIKAMANGALRFYLDAAAANGRHRLNQAKPAGATSVEQTIDFADRKDAGWQPAQSIMSKALESRNDLAFVSEPLQQSLDINGFLSGRLDFKVNKMDLDLRFALYELLPGGDYLQLFDTAQFRASYARDRVHRNLLAADRRAQLAFASERLMSRRVQAGSRVVLVLGINKRPDRQLNYGTGKDVSEESIKDAATPLRIEWYDSSYIDIPVRRP